MSCAAASPAHGSRQPSRPSTPVRWMAPGCLAWRYGAAPVTGHISPAVPAGARQRTRRTSRPSRRLRFEGSEPSDEDQPDDERTAVPRQMSQWAVAGPRQGPMPRVRRAHLLTPGSDADRLKANVGTVNPLVCTARVDGRWGPGRPEPTGDATRCRRADRANAMTHSPDTVKLDRSPHLVSGARLTRGCRPSSAPPRVAAVGQVEVQGLDGRGWPWPIRLHLRFDPRPVGSGGEGVSANFPTPRSPRRGTAPT
jgi:hypothetical protein